MTESSCAAPLPTTLLLAYWLDELEAAEEERVESHLFACDGCTGLMDEVACLAAGIRLWARGRLQGGATRSLLARLANDALRVRRYRLAPGERIFCTAGAEDDFVVLELEADLARVKRVDVVWRVTSPGGVETRIEDVPVDEGARVVWAEPAEGLRQRPAEVTDVVLLAVGDAGDRVLATYHLNHIPFRPSA